MLAIRGLRGGVQGKRSRKSDGDADVGGSGIAIPQGQLAILPTDIPAVRVALAKDAVNIDAMIETMSLAKLTLLKEMTDRYERTLTNDSALRGYCELLTECEALKEHCGWQKYHK